MVVTFRVTGVCFWKTRFQRNDTHKDQDCENMLFFRAQAVDECDDYPHGKAAGAEECRNDMRALKTQGDAQ